ncbi:hypothetical protein H0H93_013900 [Arthromyces matolae]|nr:hypothetical protein H0H93_013900 [Arthromyces matolae]
MPPGSMTARLQLPGEENQFAAKPPLGFDNFPHPSHGPIPPLISEAKPRSFNTMGQPQMEEQNNERVSPRSQPPPPPSSFAPEKRGEAAKTDGQTFTGHEASMDPTMYPMMRSGFDAPRYLHQEGVNPEGHRFFDPADGRGTQYASNDDLRVPYGGYPDFPPGRNAHPDSWQSHFSGPPPNNPPPPTPARPFDPPRNPFEAPANGRRTTFNQNPFDNPHPPPAPNDFAPYPPGPPPFNPPMGPPREQGSQEDGGRQEDRQEDHQEDGDHQEGRQEDGNHHGEMILETTKASEDLEGLTPGNQDGKQRDLRENHLEDPLEDHPEDGDQQ